MKEVLSIDIETRSRLDLSKVGVYKYAENCEVLLFSYSWNDDCIENGWQSVETIDLYKGEELPLEIVSALVDKDIVKRAYNAQFERIVLANYLNNYLDPKQWFDTMTLANYLSLPAKLDDIAKFLFPEDTGYHKDSGGSQRLKMFSLPNYRNPDFTKEKDRDYWQDFIRYNKKDVYVECMVHHALSKFFGEVSSKEYGYWVDDQKINDLGVRLDENLVNSVIKILDELSYREVKNFMELTGGLKPSQNVAFAKWLSEETGVHCSSVSKENLKIWYDSLSVVPEKVDKAIKLKSLMGKTSLAKFQKMKDCICGDGRARGLFQYYGGSRTGRFSGRLIQLQNLKRNNLPDIGLWREMVCRGSLEELEMLTDDVPDVLSQLVRTAIIPREGYEFIVSDFHAIEAVISAWVAGEKWRLEVFRTDGRIYEASASQMFNVPVNTITTPDGKHGENYFLRAKGKVAELALGYGGGAGALEKMGGAKLGLTDEEMRNIVYLWRTKSPRIVEMWNRIDGAMRSIIMGTSQFESITNSINIMRENEHFVSIELPSLRKLYYYEPHFTVKQTPYGINQQSLVYWGRNQTSGKWEEIDTRGSKLFENIVQAIARDILCHAIHNVRLEHLDVVMHIHDEIVVETPKNTLSVDDINLLMTDLPHWASGMPLTSAGFKTEFYMKD